MRQLFPNRTMDGFTLTELLVAVAIVGFLTALVVPVLRSARTGAEAAKCSSNLKQIGSAIMLYAGEHNMMLPPGWEQSKDANGVYGTSNASGYPGAYVDVGPKPWKIFSCPSDRTRVRWNDYTSYAYNYSYLVRYVNGVPDPDSGKRYIRVEEAQDKILYVDGIDPLEAESWTEGWPRPTVNGNGVAGALLSQWANSTISKRHNGNVNALFGDGSVRYLRKKEACQSSYLDLD